MTSAKQKMKRAGKHYAELADEVRSYFKTGPGALVEASDSTATQKRLRFRETEPLPPAFGLIAGDCLQNMRSALDYLVWELVEANGAAPSERNMFPITLTEQAWKQALLRGRLQGVSAPAIDIILMLQPFKADRPNLTALYTLDLLTNISKHRRLPLMSLQGAAANVAFEFLHNLVTITKEVDGVIVETFQTRAYVSLNEGPAKDREICLILATLAEAITRELLPMFEPFFADGLDRRTAEFNQAQP